VCSPSFFHSGSTGDVIYSLPTIIALSENKPAHVYLSPGTSQATFPRAYAESLLPLLRSQPYIGTAGLANGGRIDYDLDRFRRCGLNLAAFSIARWYQAVWPISLDLSRPWLNVTPSEQFRGKIVLNRTTRYRNAKLSYSFLSGREDVVFVGTREEAAEIGGTVHRIPCFTARNFLELAQWIAGCRLFVGNQSSCFALAEALKVNRVLEVCPSTPNVIPEGPGAWLAFDQEKVRQALDLLE
jgi:hypothetical protein